MKRRLEKPARGRGGSSLGAAARRAVQRVAADAGLVPWLAAALLAAGLGGCPPLSPPPDGSLRIRLQRVADGFVSPVDLAAPADGTGRLFVADQVGVIWVVAGDGSVGPTPLLDLRARVDRLNPAYDERGLLGLALHPGFNRNGKLYVFHTTPPTSDAPPGTATEVRIAEYRMSASDPNRVDPATERVILRVAKPQTNHNGGQLAFGPDGFLYIALGDGGGAGDIGPGHTPNLGNAQDRSTLLGKILRIDVDGGLPYSVPASNPFVGLGGGARPEIFAYGFRNPWRFSFDTPPDGPARLFAADAGQFLMEEVNLVEIGGNYGWNRKEGTLCFDPRNMRSPPDVCLDEMPDGSVLRPPILVYRHVEGGVAFGSAVVGGFVYRGTNVPVLRGRYVFGDYGASTVIPSGRLFAATEAADGTWSFAELAVASAATGRLNGFLLGFGRDAAGELYVLTRTQPGPTGTSGAVHRIVPAP
mgnify:CR=1 FL=1